MSLSVRIMLSDRDYRLLIDHARELGLDNIAPLAERIVAHACAATRNGRASTKPAPVKTRNRVWTPERQAEARELRAQGLSWPTIAKRVGVSLNTVYNHRSSLEAKP